jgi:5-methylcytosine-specific restriction enzyme subunit McrC
VKYVATLLVGQVSLSKTQKELDELLFLLDEVELKVMTLEDCDGLAFNPIQEDIKRVLDLCRLFLSGSSCFTNTEDFEAFAFIVPSEKVFEQFLFSILEQSRGTFIENVRKGVPGRQFLAKEMPVGRDRFKMENDIVVELSIGRTVILDAKYKNLRASNSPSLRLTPDETVGVSQTDIYQMVSYAVGSGVRNLGLIYPKFAASHDERKCLSYRVKNALDESLIRIRGVEIDITSPKIDVGGPSCSLQELFQETKKRVSEDLVLIVHKVAEEGDRSPWDQLG